MLLSLLLLIPLLGALVLILWPGAPTSARLREVTIVLLTKASPRKAARISTPDTAVTIRNLVAA